VKTLKVVALFAAAGVVGWCVGGIASLALAINHMHALEREREAML
jgi:hypothetical protein